MANDSDRKGEVRNPLIDRRSEGDFAERIGRGLKSAADLMRRSGRARAETPAAKADPAGRTWDVDRLALHIASRAAKFLGTETGDPDADFFNMGGTSVDAVTLVAELAREIGVQITLDELFADARPRRLAERWLSKIGAAPTAPPTIVKAPSPTVPTPTTPASEDMQEALRAIQADLDLANSLPWVAAPVLEPPRRILLTGATGFLGAHLLFDLLRRSDAHVVCLVRAKDDVEAEERLASELTLRDLPWSSELKRRVTAVSGDIQQPSLGWTRERWDTLAAEVDSVVNVAAAVDFLRGYHSLRLANVIGPLTLAQFATTGRIKPLHQVSTISIFDELGIASIGEDDPVARIDRLYAGYEQTKWAAEALLRRARERGLVVTFLRPGGIGGHTDTGVYNPQDLNSGFMAAWMLLRAMPEFRYMNIAPVDWVSRIASEIVLDPEAWGRNYHLTGKPLSLPEAVRDMAVGGMKMRVLTFEAWRDLFLERMAAEPVPYLDFVARVFRSPAALKLIEATLTAPAATAARTDAFVARRRLPRARRYDGTAQVATLERLARDGRGTLPSREDQPLLRLRERLTGLIGPEGPSSDTPFSAELTLSVASFYQILKERRVDISGFVTCSRLHTEPLRIESGDCWFRPDDGVPERHGIAHPLLRYRLVLRTADRQRWWLEGKKTARPGFDPLRQARTLEVTLGREGEPASLSGQLEVPADSFWPDQVEGIEVDPSVPSHERRLAKLLWLLWFGGQFGLGFLDPMLRAAVELLDVRAQRVKRP